MKVLMISGDAAVLQEGTAANKRYKLQAAQVEKLSVLMRKPSESKFAAARRMIKEGKRETYDFVTAQDPFWLGYVAKQIAAATGAKLQLQIHTDLAAQPFWKRWLAHYNLRRAVSVRVVSERIKNSLQPLGLSAPIAVLPIYIDKEAIRSAPLSDIRQAFPQFEKLVLVASRLEPEKDVALAIKAMPEILSAVPKTGMIIAGDGSQLEALQLLARNLKVEPSVIFLGHRPDIFSLYKSADVLLNTSRFEGFGASVVEALAAGCAVVSTDVGVAGQAGAVLASKKDLGKKAVAILLSGAKGELKMPLPPALEWAMAWRDTLNS